MQFSILFCKNFIYKSFFIGAFENNHFLYLYFSFHFNKLSIKINKKIHKNIGKNFATNSRLYFVIGNKLLSKTQIQTSRVFASLVYFLRSNEVEIIYIRIKSGYVYVLSLIAEKIISKGFRRISVLYGANDFGQGDISNSRNDIFHTKGFNSVIFGIFLYFPCFFLKKFRIMRGMKILNHLNTTFVLLMIIKIFKKLFFFKLDRFQNYVSDENSQIGNFTVTKNSVLVNSSVLKNKIFIAISSYNSIVTWRITFNSSKNLKEIRTCARSAFFGNSIILLLKWGGVFYNYLFTGETDSKITIWNEFLFPVLKINTKKTTPIVMCVSLEFFGFFLIFRKHLNRKKKSKNNRFFILPRTTVRLYTNRVQTNSSLPFVFDKLYYLKITKNIRFLSNLKNILKLDKKLNKNSFLKYFLFNFLLNVFNKIQTDGGVLEFLLFVYKFIRYNLWSCFFFNDDFVFFIIKKEILYQVRKVSQVRKFSIYELETEKKICEKNFFFYKTCGVCKRISKFKQIHKNIKKTCQFFHCSSEAFYFFPVYHKPKFSENFKLYLLCQKKLCINQIFRIFFNIHRNFPNQREFIWLWKKIQ